MSLDRLRATDRRAEPIKIVHSAISAASLKLFCSQSLFLLNCFTTALHGMHTRSSDENSVRPSVRPSVCPSVIRVNYDKTVERSVQIYIPYERPFSLVF